MKPNPTKARIDALLRYDPESGIFTSLVSRGRAVAGSRAGWVAEQGYRKIVIDGYRYLEHRVAWLCVHGYWPSMQIDHIDGNTANNAIANLREASNAQNCMNKPKPKSNTSGFKGVRYHSRDRRWYAHIRLSGKQVHLGLFDTAEEAHAAYCEAAHRLHGEFARTK